MRPTRPRPTLRATRRPAALLAATLVVAGGLLAGCNKPGDGASGVNPPSGTRAPGQVPPSSPRQP